MPEAVEDDEPGFLASAGATLRLIVGWACVALGVLDLAMGLDDPSYVIFHVVLLVTGVLLLAGDRIGRRLTVTAWTVGGLVAALGLAITAIPSLAVACCSRDYAVRHGFPFTMLARDPGGWRFDLYRSIADLLFWLCAGLIALTVVAWVRPARPAPQRDEAAPPSHAPTHAEERAHHHEATGERHLQG
ncbi:hypothetical protein [Paractinoplanes maris]|uniref:hypothetical protein n=1 Tax=Paractinoplanes maris TaxID=1734446 RepID=UPI00202215D6|nr:hypothetical protein [Actinoplanes maris]